MFGYIHILQGFMCLTGMKAFDTCSTKSQALRAAQKFYPESYNTAMSCSSTNKLNLGKLF